MMCWYADMLIRKYADMPICRYADMQILPWAYFTLLGLYPLSKLLNGGQVGRWLEAPVCEGVRSISSDLKEIQRFKRHPIIARTT